MSCRRPAAAAGALASPSPSPLRPAVTTPASTPTTAVRAAPTTMVVTSAPARVGSRPMAPTRSAPTRISAPAPAPSSRMLSGPELARALWKIHQKIHGPASTGATAPIGVIFASPDEQVKIMGDNEKVVFNEVVREYSAWAQEIIMPNNKLSVANRRDIDLDVMATDWKQKLEKLGDTNRARQVVQHSFYTAYQKNRTAIKSTTQYTLAEFMYDLSMLLLKETSSAFLNMYIKTDDSIGLQYIIDFMKKYVDEATIQNMAPQYALHKEMLRMADIMANREACSIRPWRTTLAMVLGGVLTYYALQRFTHVNDVNWPQLEADATAIQERMPESVQQFVTVTCESLKAMGFKIASSEIGRWLVNRNATDDIHNGTQVHQLPANHNGTDPYEMDEVGDEDDPYPEDGTSASNSTAHDQSTDKEQQENAWQSLANLVAGYLLEKST